MAGIFEDIQFQKTDLNTVKELKEDCWRKAQGEDLEAFLGFYLKETRTQLADCSLGGIVCIFNIFR